MKINEWINQKLWQSTFISLAPSVEHARLIQVQERMSRTAKTCLERFYDEVSNLHHVCIHYDINVAIALKVVLKHNWLIWKISVILAHIRIGHNPATLLQAA
ncbi:hypothetical protein [Nostoc sp. 'Peltigera membranacea cyanobiont' N6]|uniref:hypothetical protein n=1 Tax=Nostoc sp. 'Peltigera membranacea cyanobiont' N6 TaxID=1261031 RepID=UPI000D0C673F|nr:hypothetical protein [Nostoc sp. 'Peltigera membranacea cyanobiont' N6]AVH63298.1 hypothetical protein NPM_1474 [Nostoc sp. 'Peltigera membranacea cyanobiont' N6]